MICDICGTDKARIRRRSKSFGKGNDLFVIENVPVISCSHCGESYMTAETIREIDRLNSHRQNIAENRQVAVARFLSSIP